MLFFPTSTQMLEFGDRELDEITDISKSIHILPG